MSRKSGAKSFVVEKRINGIGRRKTLGRYGVLTVEQARKEAQKFLGKVATGIDPIAEKRDREAKGVTLGEAFEEYLKLRHGLKPGTVHDYRRSMREFFPDWLNRPLQTISKDAVAHRHAKNSHRPVRANNAFRVLRAVFNLRRGNMKTPRAAASLRKIPTKRISHNRAWYRVERRRTIIKWDQLPAWFEAVNGLKSTPNDFQAHSVGDFLLLLLFTGMRRSEGLRLAMGGCGFCQPQFHPAGHQEPRTSYAALVGFSLQPAGQPQAG